MFRRQARLQQDVRQQHPPHRTPKVKQPGPFRRRQRDESAARNAQQRGDRLRNVEGDGGVRFLEAQDVVRLAVRGRGGETEAATLVPDDLHRFAAEEEDAAFFVAAFRLTDGFPGEGVNGKCRHHIRPNIPINLMSVDQLLQLLPRPPLPHAPRLQIARPRQLRDNFPHRLATHLLRRDAAHIRQAHAPRRALLQQAKNLLCQHRWTETIRRHIRWRTIIHKMLPRTARHPPFAARQCQ